jgi:hypothetical protein
MMEHTDTVDIAAAHVSDSVDRNWINAPSKISTTNAITAVEQPADVGPLTAPFEIPTSISQSLPLFSGLLDSIRLSSTTNTTAEVEQRVSLEAPIINDTMDITVQEHQLEQLQMDIETETAGSTEPMKLDNTTGESVQSESSMDVDQDTSAESDSQASAIPLTIQDQ